MYAGTVGWFAVPSLAIATGSPAALFWTSTATAPALYAFRIFVENEHEPREMSAILPLSDPAGKGEHA